MQENLSIMIKRLTTLFLLSSVFCLYSQNQDALLWTSASIKGKLSKDFNFELNTQLRFSDNMSQIAKSIVEGSVDYELGNRFKITAGYRLSNSREKYNFVLKNRIYSDFDFDYKIIKKLDLEVRLRAQYVFSRLQPLNEYILPDDKTLLRLKYGFQYKIDDWKPSISHELFFDPNEKLLATYRLNCGISYKINKRHALKVEYTFQKDLSNIIYREYIYQLGYTYNLKGKLLKAKK